MNREMFPTKEKKIDKFLVNGEDVLSTGGHALKTLSADFASGVELLSNYNDGNVGNSLIQKRRQH